MNKYERLGKLFFFHIIIPLAVSLIAKVIIGLCTKGIDSSDFPDNETINAILEMIDSLVIAFEWVIAAFIGTLSYFFITSLELKEGLSGFKTDFGNKLVKTNAVMVNPETNKIAVTARQLDFYARAIYDEIERYSDTDKRDAESIDILRWYSIQDLLFSPKYLHYFFSRGKQIGIPIRIVVIEKVCLATISYILLNLKANYKVYLISNKNFRNFCSEQRVTAQRMLKGNPYLIKIQKIVKYGKYTSADNSAQDVPNMDEAWALCNTLKSLSREITSSQETFTIRQIEDFIDGI